MINLRKYHYVLWKLNLHLKLDLQYANQGRYILIWVRFWITGRPEKQPLGIHRDTLRIIPSNKQGVSLDGITREMIMSGYVLINWTWHDVTYMPNSALVGMNVHHAEFYKNLLTPARGVRFTKTHGIVFLSDTFPIKSSTIWILIR